jgi:hypothetical protein
VHERVVVPQLPHAVVSTCPAVHSETQPPHWQLLSHVWVEPVPQACVCPGPHEPSPVQLPHDDHVPLSQVRVCVPQLPQLCVDGPVQSDLVPQMSRPFTLRHSRPSGHGLPHVGDAPAGAQGETPVWHSPGLFEQQTHSGSV